MIPIPLSPFLALEAETHGDLELQQTCQALHAELQNNLTYSEGPLSSDTVVRHDVSSPLQEEVALLDVSMPHHPPVNDGKMYADTGWCMSYQNCDPLGEESNHPETHCQAPIIPPCDHVVPDVLLRTSQHRSAPNDHTGQPPPVCGTPPAYQPSPSIEYAHPGRPCPQVDSPPVFSSQSSNCSDNGDNVPTQSQDEHLDTQTDVQVLAENISDYDYDDNHSHSSPDDKNTNCHDSDYQHGYPPDPLNLIDHSDLDSSCNSDNDSWFSLENSPGHPPVSLENPPAKASPHKAMPEEQPLDSQPTKSQAVMTKELAGLRQDTLAYEHDHFTLVSQTYKLEIQANQLALAHKQKQSQSDISPAQADVSYINPGSLPYPSVDCIPACRDTLVPDGILQRQVLPRPKRKPWLSKKDIPPWPDVPKLQKDVPPWPHIPKPQPKPRLSLKWTSERHANHYSHAQPLVFSGHAYGPSLLSSKGLSPPMSHDENAHHVVPHKLFMVAPTSSKNKLNPSTKKLYGCDPVPPDLTASHLCRDKSWLAKRTGPVAKKTCRACAVPNRYFIHCHELLPQFLSQIDMSADVLRESDLFQETVSDVSEYMLHEANNPIDSGYHSPKLMVPANPDASSNPVSMVPVSTNKVPCPFPKGGTLVDLPCNKNEVLSSVLCKDTGCPDVKFPGQVLSLASTPRVNSENLTSAHSIFTPLGKF